MPMRIYKNIFVFSLLLISHTILPQTDTSEIVKSKSLSQNQNGLVYGFNFIYGFMIPHAKEVFNVREARPKGYEIDVYWHLNNDDVWDDCHCYPRVGAFISFYDFDINEILGYGYSGGLSFTYFFGIPSNLNFHLKGKAGLAYLTNPFNKETQTSDKRNWSYSTHLNCLLSAGVGFTLKLSDQIETQFDWTMNHQSNAAYLEPNGGVNFWAAGLSVNYYSQIMEFKERFHPDPYLTAKKKNRWDLSFSWGISSMPYPMPGQVPMYGITISRSIQTWRFVALYFGAELERNARAVEIYRRKYPGEDVDPLRASLLTGVEFQMGKVNFTAQMGGYVYRPFKEKDDLYQRWGLMYNVFNNVYAGLNFKSYGSHADHLSLRFTYSF